MICLLEAHGSHLTMLSIFSRCLRTHHLLRSQVRDSFTGEPILDAVGACVLVARDFFRHHCSNFRLHDPPPSTAASFHELNYGRAVHIQLFPRLIMFSLANYVTPCLFFLFITSVLAPGLPLLSLTRLMRLGRNVSGLLTITP